MAAELGQDRHRDAADAPVGAGDEDLSFDAVIFEREHAEHRREARRPDRHRLPRREGVWQRNKPVAVEPRALREAAPMLLAQPAAGGDDRVSGSVLGMLGGGDDAGEVDAGDHRIGPGDRGRAGERQRVLVVQRRIGHVDAHRAVR